MHSSTSSNTTANANHHHHNHHHHHANPFNKITNFLHMTKSPSQSSQKDQQPTFSALPGVKPTTPSTSTLLDNARNDSGCFEISLPASVAAKSNTYEQHSNSSTSSAKDIPSTPPSIKTAHDSPLNTPPLCDSVESPDDELVDDHHHNVKTRDCPDLVSLLVKNREWAAKTHQASPQLFKELAQAQNPQILWIGCSDSRVPAEQITQKGPGDLFVHRNSANVVISTDFSMLSVLQYAVEVLKVKHIIVCGHYQCGGCAAAMSNKQYGLIDNWLRNIKDVYTANKKTLDAIEDADDRCARLVELNTARSVHNICHTAIVQNAWANGQDLSVHGLVYRISDGHLVDIDLCLKSPKAVDRVYSYTPKLAASKMGH